MQKKISAILFDLIGTTVIENDPDFINNCFQDAFSTHGILIGRSDVLLIRGREKHEAIREILRSRDNDLALGATIFQTFNQNVAKGIGNFREHPDLYELVQRLRKEKILIGIGSGLPQAIFNLIFQHLSWNYYQFDYVSVFERFPAGRPAPHMIADMRATYSIPASQFLKVGDTVADIEEGINAGVQTGLVYGTTQPRNFTKHLTPDFTFTSLLDVLKVI